ncbi:hypothetical protein A8C32_15990 [Flavivirga aquatica]|uniref:DUF885 domain-containing protein n=1 Tax=Flavivirga aquatica TaxID=1849968 RepID=A0A1E5T9P1_9FLAO|nr:DUF885 domain-containing protein [Flavivirga aquatica]OEK08081.1 hypothetical protein A8C32_15990 [Flavivirga aquatica]
MALKNLLSIVLIITLFSCKQDHSKKPEINNIDSNEITRLNQWFDTVFERNLMDSPQMLSRLGRKDRQSELNDISEAFRLKNIETAKSDLADLLKFDTTKLDQSTHLSYRLFKQNLERQIAYAKYNHYTYPVNQMRGLQSSIPAFMINMHKVENKEDALAYVNRLRAVKPLFKELIINLKIRADKGIIAPKFVFAHVFNDCQNVIGDSNISNSLFVKDLTSKLENIDLREDEKAQIIADAELAVKDNVVVAYKNLISYLKELEQKATTDAGVWKFKDGANFYKYRLEEITTTKLTSDEIFNLGITEVARIHDEMKSIMKTVNFKGSLQDFFKFMKNDKQFYYEDGQEGKNKMLEGYQTIVDSMESRLDEVFFTKPKARMQVKAVEEWREQSAGKAFYQRGTPDGKRKGTFYANLYKMADMPIYEMEALAYHEGIPGHHMQGSISQELTDLPKFRKYSHYTAYSEGWGLYCELLPKEMGFYADPYSDFGRLAMEVWRACRLVVDTGIHEKKWTREQAIQYLMDNTPSSKNGCTKAIERYIVMPGQATAYKVGMLHILKMREKARKALKEQFDIREFHDIFLRSGAVPLNIFEENINNWILSKTEIRK